MRVCCKTKDECFLKRSWYTLEDLRRLAFRGGTWGKLSLYGTHSGCTPSGHQYTSNAGYRYPPQNGGMPSNQQHVHQYPSQHGGLPFSKQPWPQVHQGTGGAPLRVLSYNIWWWGSLCPQDRRDYACLTGMHAYWKSLPTLDLVGVQECDGGWATLKKYLNGALDYIREARIDGNLCTLYNPARFNLISSGRKNVWSHRYAAYIRLGDRQTGQTIFFVNTHWDHQRQHPYRHAQNTKSLIQENSILGDILIVVGDFNQNTYIPAFGKIFQGELGLRCEGIGSSHDQIDMVWTNYVGSSSCQSPEDSVQAGRGSDHNPVLCEFSHQPRPHSNQGPNFPPQVGYEPINYFDNSGFPSQVHQGPTYPFLPINQEPVVQPGYQRQGDLSFGSRTLQFTSYQGPSCSGQGIVFELTSADTFGCRPLVHGGNVIYFFATCEGTSLSLKFFKHSACTGESKQILITGAAASGLDAGKCAATTSGRQSYSASGLFFPKCLLNQHQPHSALSFTFAMFQGPSCGGPVTTFMLASSSVSGCTPMTVGSHTLYLFARCDGSSLALNMFKDSACVGEFKNRLLTNRMPKELEAGRCAVTADGAHSYISRGLFFPQC